MRNDINNLYSYPAFSSMIKSADVDVVMHVPNRNNSRLPVSNGSAHAEISRVNYGNDFRPGTNNAVALERVSSSAGEDPRYLRGIVSYGDRKLPSRVIFTPPATPATPATPAPPSRISGSRGRSVLGHLITGVTGAGIGAAVPIIYQHNRSDNQQQGEIVSNQVNADTNNKTTPANNPEQLPSSSDFFDKSIDWIKENPVLAGAIGIGALGLGGLGAYAFSDDDDEEEE